VRAQSFGKLWDQPLDGFVNGSPLQVSGINVGGQKRDVVYAATERNSVYALDAASGKVLWSRKQLAPPITAMEFSGEWRPNIVHGVLSTPVIDLSSGTIYICGLHAPGLRQQFVVWALDIRTGKNAPGWPVVVRGSYAIHRFVPGQVMQRGAFRW
jgi:outer membrane protein assembly factor BamB